MLSSLGFHYFLFSLFLPLFLQFFLPLPGLLEGYLVLVCAIQANVIRSHSGAQSSPSESGELREEAISPRHASPPHRISVFAAAAGPISQWPITEEIVDGLQAGATLAERQCAEGNPGLGRARDERPRGGLEGQRQPQRRRLHGRSSRVTTAAPAGGLERRPTDGKARGAPRRDRRGGSSQPPGGRCRAGTLGSPRDLLFTVNR